MEILAQGEERSVSELAHMINASGAATHYHVDQLEQVGLVIRSGKRRIGPRAESLFRAVSTRIQIDHRSNSPEYMQALLDLALSKVHRLERDLVDAHALSPQDPEIPAVRIITRRGSLKPEDVLRVRELLREAGDLLQPKLGEIGAGEFAIHAFLVRLPQK
jgi:predicted ArsR family transcriptional regulator